MGTEPLVSVLMPVYNGERFLAEAIESILNQTFTDFELIVINDGSTDASGAILDTYCQRDSRIRIFSQENRGLVETLNCGLRLARGRYLARLDADDLALPERLEKQAAFLEDNPGSVMVGSAFQSITEGGALQKTVFPPEHDTLIRWSLLFDNPFAHSAVMLRMETVQRYSLEYPANVMLAEDYAMWSQLLKHGQGDNLPVVLLKRRFHGGQISEGGSRSQVSTESAAKVAQDNLRELGIDLPLDQVRTLRSWDRQFPRLIRQEDGELCRSLLAALNRFCALPRLNPAQLRLVRGRVVLRLLAARSQGKRRPFWKMSLLYPLKPRDLVDVAVYWRYRQTVQKKVKMADVR